MTTSAYKQFIAAAPRDRLGLFLETANRLGTPIGNVEKDFWVCWALNALYQERPAGSPRLLFKGGTSLSKAYGLIRRFSEDIDITVYRDDLHEPASVEDLEALSSKKRRARLDTIRDACQAYITGPLLEFLAAQLADATGGAGRIEVDEADPDGQTLLVWYPEVESRECAYVRPAVRIESGAKSALEPNGQVTILPYISEELSGFDLKIVDVTTIEATRTLWDKVVIAHGLRRWYERRGVLRQEGQRVSRHYYDLHCLLASETGKAALSWEVNRNNYLYTFVATGYKQGGLNLPIGFTLQKPFRAEYVWDYEAGWKASAFNDHLRTQLDGYYDRFHNFQVTIGDPMLPTQQLEVNNPSPTTLYGVEASLQAIVGHLSVDANAAIEHTSLGKFFATDPRIPGFAVCNPLSGPGSVTCVNLSGHPQSYAPKVTYNVTAQYSFNLPGGDTLTTRANYSHVGSQWATLFDNSKLGDFLGVRNLLSAQISYGLRDWTVTAYGTNLTNEHYVGAMISQLDFAGAPRQYGIRVMKTF